MLHSIIKKEWLKLKLIISCIAVLTIFILVHFWYNLNFSFSTIEPENMMWYRFSSLEQKPYEYLFYLYFILGVLISIFQFVPEKIKNRIKIMFHLPISPRESIFLHLFIGIFYILISSAIITLATILIISLYYPDEIIFISLKDMGFYTLGSIIAYIGFSSVIIEKKYFVSILKLLVTILCIFIFYKTTFCIMDLLWILVCIGIFFVALDSFYSIKEQRLQSPIFGIFSLLSILIILYFSHNLYANRYKHEFNKYYVFYSPIIKKFIYQKNFGEHRFEYGVKGEKTFNRIKYESYLPFVYWRNLDIQKKLPLNIDSEIFDKKTIKDSRLSFSYNPSLLKKQEVQIYPLINAQSKKGIIEFPKKMLALKRNSINIYSFHEGLDKNLTNELNELALKNKVKFPIKNIWGKSTNMKPFDLGYFMLDGNNKLLQLKRYDDKIYFNEISYPKNIKLEFMKINENKQKKLAGYAIDSKGSFYIFDFKTFKFQKIPLNGFDYKNMRLLLISNPKYYLVRYTDQKNYYVVVFDKSFKKIDEEIYE